MASDTRSDPRRVNGVTAYFVGESTAARSADKTWDRVRLTAKKLMVLTKYSNELNEDAVLNIGDDLAGEIAYAFALKEDQCGFMGDGTSTYGGITGVIPTLRSRRCHHRQHLPAWSSPPAPALPATTMASCWPISISSSRCCPNMPTCRARRKLYCCKFFWGSVMQKLATDAGGNRVAELMNAAAARASWAIRRRDLAGDAQSFGHQPGLLPVRKPGDGRPPGRPPQTTIQMSEHALNAFEQDEVVIRGTERFDIVVHDVGTTAAAGPIVGLITAAS